MKTRGMFLILLVTLLGCSGPTAEVETIHEEFYATTLYRMTGNVLDAPSDSGGTLIELNTEKYRSEEGEIQYSLIVEYLSSEWLFIREGESLILDVDGERLGLSGRGSTPHREIKYGGRISEKAWYPVSLDDLKRMAAAETVKVTVIGTRRRIERYFSEENFENIAEFVRKYGA